MRVRHTLRTHTMRRPLLLAALCCLVAASAASAASTAAADAGAATDAPAELLRASETADAKKVDIVKQIRRLNDDGSYTVGYEAGDGTFKIESRDALGNVKGTFGYVDRAGEIKRVTYSSSNASTPTAVPVGAGPTSPASPTTPAPSAAGTRRPLATVVYPRAGSPAPRGTVIQPIPRRRLVGGTDAPADSKAASETTTSATAYGTKIDDSFTKMIKMKSTENAMALAAKQTSTEASARASHAAKPVYEPVTEAEAPPPPRASQVRRQLPGAAHDNPHMLSLRQSAGDDAADVYGGHRSLGTARPLFTTTTQRPRLAPFTSILSARQRLHEHAQRYGDVGGPETALEASGGRAYERESVTSSPVPAVLAAAPAHRDRADEAFPQATYRRAYPNVQFRTTEYLRDNPGAPVPIGNQRPYLEYDFRSRPQFFVGGARPTAPPAAATQVPYAVAPVTRIVPIAVDERGVPIPGYRFATNPFEAPPRPPPEPAADEMQSITTPVSTRDLRRLLHILLLRQSRLQALMDELASAAPPHRAQPQYEYRPSYRQLFAAPPPPPYRPPPPPPPPQYDGYRAAYREQPAAYDERQAAYEERQRLAQQRELYSSRGGDYGEYESERVAVRRRAQYAPGPYDTEAAQSGGGGGEYLPADVREALLLKMLMLAISPDYMPHAPAAAPPPPTELTTAAPAHRKQVRNVQVLGEEGSKDELERRRAAHAH